MELAQIQLERFTICAPLAGNLVRASALQVMDLIAENTREEGRPS